MADVLDLRRLDVPIVQAGMGSISRHELAVAVSEAGGLGTIAGVQAPIGEELAAARRLTGRPIAVNLLLPFVGPGDVQAAAAADVLVTFWGEPRRLAAGTWIHQCGSVAEAKAAPAAGADAVIAQGVEAPHRVIPNDATRRWLGDDPRGPRWIRIANRFTRPLAARISVAVQARALKTQRRHNPSSVRSRPQTTVPSTFLARGHCMPART
jgi:NAD(P)H-dependent flavin oxidoreductase YrpB (nitropropane dioxygenase family)